MGLRFFKRVTIFKGLRLNLSKGAVSMSAGRKGLQFTAGTAGSRFTAGLPGTGLYYTEKIAKKKRNHSSGKDNIEPSENNNLNPGFFKKLFMSSEEKKLIEALRELSLGSEESARDLLKEVHANIDAAYLSGFLELKSNEPALAEGCFKYILETGKEPGNDLDELGISAQMRLPITDEIGIIIEPGSFGVKLGLIEALQEQEKIEDAIKTAKELYSDYPDNLSAALSLAELLAAELPISQDNANSILEITENLENLSELHAALLLYKARALFSLAMYEAARLVLNQGLRRKKDRSKELLTQLRVERAKTLLELGQKSKAKKDLEVAYLENKDFPGIENLLKSCLK